MDAPEASIDWLYEALPMKKLVFACVIAINCLFAAAAVAEGTDGDAWPPALPGAKSGTATLTLDAFLQVPEKVAAARADTKAAPFEMAKTAPTVELAYH